MELTLPHFELSLYHFIGLSMVLFVTGAMGVLLRRNVLIVLMSLELMLNAANLCSSHSHGSMPSTMRRWLFS